ncbi:oligopeptide/dipeptide ABC transporter ATP-binding protein [Nocardioides sambongensis]|uniref:oligopeptide/dipeptide ABC transporter ATP-binding protein n=1 Tax=Nocardioides sambongensis TaxID=2589074 RepID=UPI001126EA32|nr:oligopeptide/dipeptide ABC transporter ATP-binding protein [Nocardioides sambongensis]
MAGTGNDHLRDEDSALLTVDDLVVEFPAARGARVHAVSGISFDLLAGETLGILGESGCGKSSAGRALMQLPPPTSGRVRLEGRELTGLPRRAVREARAAMQMIFEDPISSLNPRRRVRDLVAEGPRMRGQKVSEQQIREALAAVGLDLEVVGDRRPHELSGGQCQRLCIARALMLEPKVLICDEPVSSLDVSVQAQILNLLADTKESHALSMVFIAHDVVVVKNVSDRVMVMYLGKVCEVIGADDLADGARHPYTRLLLASVPEVPAAGEQVGGAGVGGAGVAEVPGAGAPGELPSPLDPPSGCRFRTRCPLATDRCAGEEPVLREVGEGRFVACHHV